MKSTKEITTGAMLLAIFGAVLLIDRYLSFMFTEIICLAAPVVIIIFGNMYNFKDGVIFSIALLLISIVLSPNVYSYFYIAIGAIVADIYNFLCDKGANPSALLLFTAIIFVIADICYMFVISPLLLHETFDQYVATLLESINQILPEEFLGTFESMGLSFDQLLRSIGLASFVLTGLMEGVIVHLISSLLLKRFNIKPQTNVNHILQLKPVPAYILFGCSALILAYPYIKNPTLASIFVIVGAISLFVLAYYGYIYFLMFLRVRYNKNYGLLVILAIVFLFPISVYILFFTGFLYGAGPLKRYLIVERKKDEQN